MKNLLFLIVFAALFLHFYPQPKITAFYETQKAHILTVFSDATDTRVKLKADKIYTDLKPQLKRFQSAEITHLKNITHNRHNVKQYYTEYCGNKRDTKFHQSNQTLVCNTIANYSSLL